MKTIFGIIGIVIGAWIGEWENDPLSGAAIGFFIGLLAGALINTKNRLLDLEKRLKQFQETLVDSASVTTSQAKKPPTTAPDFGTGDISEDTSEIDTTATTEIPKPSVAQTASKATDAGWQSAADAHIPDQPENRVIQFIKRFFTTGNVVVKVGVILLIFGASFLIRYAAEREMLPVELRLAAIAAGAIVMLIVGWRLRFKNANYALVLQGGAVGILYLTVFASAKLNVLPLTLAFFIMLGLVIFSCLLAILQDSRTLAMFATAGGFLAPILVSTGSGNHVALFSYYAFLNAGIFGIAWYKSWRGLNWLGFLFTFIIGSLWGIEYYSPEKFATTEPFLILFFVFYLAIAILFAHQQPPRLKGLVDGSLVFGTPLVGFVLQSALVQDFAFGQAYSALGMGAIYTVLAVALWKRQVDGMRMLTESFLALGVIFLSLAIPFALDGRWTAAAWALEGAGITWVGIRQQRLLARVFGLLLQIGAGLAFFSTIGHPHGNLPVLNSDYVGSVLIAIAGLFIGLNYYRHREAVKEPEKDLHYLLLAWGLLWWFGAGLMEIDYHLPARYELNASLFFIAASFLLATVLARRLGWIAAELPALFLLPVMIIIGLIQYDYGVNPFAHLGFIAWIAAFVIQYRILHWAAGSWRHSLLEKWHAGTLYILMFILTWIIAHGISRHVTGLYNWDHIFWGLVPAIMVFAVMNLKSRLRWPITEFAPAYLGTGLLPVIIYLGIWTLVICTRSGDPSPLPYYPVINPQDVAQLFALLAAIEWVANWKKQVIPEPAFVQRLHVIAAIGMVFFVWLNSLVAHGVHFYAGVPYQAWQMFNSDLFQTVISIVWTLTAFLLMGLANRLGYRKVWFTGGALLGAVVLKLFIIDLDDSGTVTRIISFMSVGILMLLIGYFSPLPPRSETRAAD